MTEEQEAHVDRLAIAFVEAMQRKYAAGVKEHGGNLWEKDALYLLDQAILENIDQFTYLSTLRDILVKILK